MSELVTKIKDSVDVIHDIGCDYSNISNPPTIPDAYTKTETDALLAGKVDNDEVYSKAVLNAILDSKADEDNVYDKSQTYSKTEVDSALALKADAADVYTKTESDTALALKANSADVYTISQTDGLLDAKASVDDSSTTATMATWSADKLNVQFQGKADTSDVYTKAEVDALVGGVKMKTFYGSGVANKNTPLSVDISALNLQSASDYFVVLAGANSGDYSGTQYNGGACMFPMISAKTATSFEVSIVGDGIIQSTRDVHFSYQVVYS